MIRCLTLALVITIGFAGDVDAQVVGRDGGLIFAKRRDQLDQLVLVDRTGAVVETLTDGQSIDYFPACSPDGRKIAFTSTRSDDKSFGDVFVMDADGRNVTQLTTGAPSRAPSWSPDGKRIAFNRHISQNGRRNLEIFVMDADGTHLVNLTRHASVDADPAWSPDGNQIAFTSNRDGKFALFVMDADGGNMRRLSQPWSVGWMWPTWSPTGKQIAYTDQDSTGAYVITTRDADGGNPRQITRRGFDTFAAWSPDGKEIAFVRITDWKARIGDLYVMDADGGNPKLLQRAAAFSETGRAAWKLPQR